MCCLRAKSPSPDGSLVSRLSGGGLPVARRSGLGDGCVSPSLLGGLAGDAESVGDLGPGVADAAQAGDGGVGGVVDFFGQGDEVAESFDVTGCDAAAVSGHDAAGEGGVVVVLDAGSVSAVRCQGAVDSVRACSAAAGHGLASRLCVRGGPFGGLPARGRDRRRGVPHVQEPPGGWTAQRRAASLMWGCGGGTGRNLAAAGVIQARRSPARQGSVVPRLVVGAMGEGAAGGASWLVPP